MIPNVLPALVLVIIVWFVLILIGILPLNVHVKMVSLNKMKHYVVFVIINAPLVVIPQLIVKYNLFKSLNNSFIFNINLQNCYHNLFY